MGVSKALLALACLACLASAALGLPTLSAIDSDLSLLESEASKSESGSSVLAAAEAYATAKVSSAISEGKSLVSAAVAAGRADAVAAGPAPLSAKAAEAKRKLAAKEKMEKANAEIKVKAAIKAEAKAKAKQIAAVAAAKHTAKLAKAKAARDLALAAAKKLEAVRNSPFRAAGFKHNKQGVFGRVNFGITKADSLPSTPAAKKGKLNALEKFSKYAPRKNIYGRRKSCLKDIAAHFDEKDIYDSKKMSLLQQMSSAKSRLHATKLRSKLNSLETWHQMMQKKFLMSATEAKAHEKRVEALFDEHLPADLKDQLKQNKVAKRAGQKTPFPLAKKQAFKILRSKRTQIQKNERLQANGHKRMLRPEINDHGFPSMDPISSQLREKLWRNVETQQEWTTDKAEMERAENIVTNAHKQHGDFVEGPIAAPILKGALYNPDTEKLGVPNFLTKFPWPLKEEEKVTMNDKMRVEQTYHSTY